MSTTGLELGGEVRLALAQEGCGVQAQEAGPEGGGFSVSPRPCSCAVEEAEEGSRALPPYSGAAVPKLLGSFQSPQQAPSNHQSIGARPDHPTPKVEFTGRRKKTKVT